MKLYYRTKYDYLYIRYSTFNMYFTILLAIILKLVGPKSTFILFVMKFVQIKIL